jgi:uncharacterized protein YlxW (UPF0749 family)
MDDYNYGSIKIRKVLIFVAIVATILGLTLWGGTSIGKSQATTDAQELSQNLTRTQDQLFQMTSMSARLDTKLTAAQDDYSQLQSQFTALQTENSALQSQLTAAQQNLSALQSQLTAAKSNVANLQAQLASAGQSNAALQTQLTTTQQNITSLQTQLSTAQQNVNTLQDQLTAWYNWLHSVPSSPSLNLSPATGPSGTSVTVTGASFITGSGAVVFFDNNRNGTLDSDELNQTVTVSAAGAFTVTFAVPAVAAGVYPVIAASLSGSTSLASINFTVTAR